MHNVPLVVEHAQRASALLLIPRCEACNIHHVQLAVSIVSYRRLKQAAVVVRNPSKKERKLENFVFELVISLKMFKKYHPL